MKSAEFIHLHNHSEYSLLDGMLKISNDDGKPSEFLKGLAAKNVKTLAITDHGNMYGAADFYFCAKDCGIKPIVGCEMYLAKGSRKEKNEKRDNSHLTLLAKDFEGYQNLMTLVSDAFVEGFYHSPRTDKEMLAKYGKGLIAMSGCLKGEVASACVDGNMDRAIQLASQFRDIMGEGNFYLELMDHGIPEEAISLKGLLEVSAKTGIPVVASNDCHYPRKEDWEAHDIHLCISTGDMLDDPNRLKMTTHEFYFKTPEEMHQLFSHTPESLSNTLAIAEKCDLQIPYGKFILPHFEIPKEYANLDHEGYLRELCLQGLKKKLGGEIPQKYMERFNYEMDIIARMGFPSYFLIVSDFITYARSHGVPVGPGRGSGAGSLVAYAMDITRVDPLVNGLLFERFLNPDRVSMPDLDIDFSDEGRQKVIEYVRGRYGITNVAQIVTFGTIKAKSAIKDVARVMGMPPQEANTLTKLIPNDLDIYGALKEVAEFQKAAANPSVKKVIEAAQKIEGLKRQTGVHAAGTIVTREAVSKYTPLARGSKEIITTQYEGRLLEKLGLLKIDFLGLRTLTVIENAVEMVRGRGVDLDIVKIPLDNEPTYELLRAGKTTCIFQLESRGMKDLVRALKPSQFSDISALVALYRPGPMQSGMLTEFVDRKHGRKKIVYEHPLMEPILKESYGTMIYQEQVMEIAKSLGGFTPGQADGLRKAMGKKNAEAMEKARTQFLAGCEKNGIAGKLASKIFNDMYQFASYGFNKSHSVAYALVSYQTAYLKANFPVEFMTAALISEIGHNVTASEDKENKIVTYIDEARSMDIPVLPPDIQKSDVYFSIEKQPDGKEAIRFGLHAIKNVGIEAANSVVAARAAGPFKSLYDLCSRLDLRQANKKALESFAKAGALDSLYPGLPPEKCRAIIAGELEKAIAAGVNMRHEAECGQGSLFGMEETMPAACMDAESVSGVEPLSEHVMLSGEKEVLGFFFSGHPLAKLEKQLKMVAPYTIDDILSGRVKDTNSVRTAGLITKVIKKQSKEKKAWAQFELEDLTGSVNINVFPQAYERLGSNIVGDTIVVVSGKLRPRQDSDELELRADEIVPLYSAISRWGRNMTLWISPAGYDDAELKAIAKMLDKHKGGVPVYLRIGLGPKKFALVETEKHVELTQAMFEDVGKVLKDGKWVVETVPS